MKQRAMVLAAVSAVFLVLDVQSQAGQKKLMTVRTAELMAQRAVAESVFGVKIKSEEKVVDMVKKQFTTSGEVQTEVDIAGIKMDGVEYDSEKDIAKATASLTLGDVGRHTGITFPDPEKKLVRVGFASSTAERMPVMKALRAAEVDAYCSLAREILGFTLTSKSTVENFILKSDEVKTRLVASIFMAELVDYGWDKDKNAYMTLQVDLGAMGKLLGQEFVKTGMVKVTGHGAAVQDYEEEKEKPAAAVQPPPAEAVREVKMNIP